MKFYRVATWLSIAVLSFSVGFISDVSDDYSEIYKNLDIFGHLYREVNTLYVDDTDPEDLMRTGIDAMLSSLDPYTNFISEAEGDDVRFMTTGQYAGVGALIGKRNERIIILEIYQGYPADKAGLQPGDELVEVDGTAIDGKTMGTLDVRNLLRGEKGSTVSITVKRGVNDRKEEFAFSRGRVKIPNVPFYGMADENVGYISISGFTQNAGLEVAEALSSLKNQNPGLSGVILDLRGNPGGRLDQAIAIANVFLPQREMIVETKGRMEGSQYVYRARRPGVDVKIPIAVLVNGRSASASEIVAGAIQDLDRGVIIGERSFGKGLVQNIRPLSYKTQLKVTTAKYYTPSGRCIQAIDYADRDDEGQVSRIPDSLRNVFYTRNGRPVRDGGGIGPDIQVEHETLPTVASALNGKGLIFDFATRYVEEHPSIGNPRDFALTNSEFDSFLQFLDEQDFSYQTRADRQLDKLKEIVEEEAYAELLEEELKALTATLEAEKEDDVRIHSEPVKDLLRREIIRRYYYQAGVIEGALRDDPDVEAAIAVLADGDRYQKLLSGQQ